MAQGHRPGHCRVRASLCHLNKATLPAQIRVALCHSQLPQCWHLARASCLCAFLPNRPRLGGWGRDSHETLADMAHLCADVSVDNLEHACLPSAPSGRPSPSRSTMSLPCSLPRGADLLWRCSPSKLGSVPFSCLLGPVLLISSPHLLDASPGSLLSPGCWL